MNTGVAKVVFKLRTTLAGKTLCARAVNICRLEAVLKWGTGRSDEGTALVTGFKDEDGFILEEGLYDILAGYARKMNVVLSSAVSL